MYELALFSGAGGGILGGILLGHRCVGAVEIEEYPRKVLLARQRDGILPWFPIWDNITTFREDNSACKEYIEWLKSIRGQLVISGGFPCQDISCAGKGLGIAGKRSGLWSEMARVIREIRPRYAFVENSPLLVRRGLITVLSDFAEMGYNARWGIVSARDAGAPHERKRIWILAYPELLKRQESVPARRETGVGEQATSERGQSSGQAARCGGILANSEGDGRRPGRPRGLSASGEGEPEQTFQAVTHSDSARFSDDGSRQAYCTSDKSKGVSEERERVRSDSRERANNVGRDWWKTEPGMGRVANGVADFMDRIHATGNGQVPAVVKPAWLNLVDTT